LYGLSGAGAGGGGWPGAGADTGAWNWCRGQLRVPGLAADGPALGEWRPMAAKRRGSGCRWGAKHAYGRGRLAQAAEGPSAPPAPSGGSLKTASPRLCWRQRAPQRLAFAAPRRPPPRGRPPTAEPHWRRSTTRRWSRHWASPTTRRFRPCAWVRHCRFRPNAFGAAGRGPLTRASAWREGQAAYGSRQRPRLLLGPGASTSSAMRRQGTQRGGRHRQLGAAGIPAGGTVGGVGDAANPCRKQTAGCNKTGMAPARCCTDGCCQAAAERGGCGVGAGTAKGAPYRFCKTGLAGWDGWGQKNGACQAS